MDEVANLRKRFAYWLGGMVAISIALGFAIAHYSPSPGISPFAAPVFVGAFALLSLLQLLLPVSREDLQKPGEVPEQLIHFVLSCIACIAIGIVSVGAAWLFSA